MKFEENQAIASENAPAATEPADETSVIIAKSHRRRRRRKAVRHVINLTEVPATEALVAASIYRDHLKTSSCDEEEQNSYEDNSQTIQVLPSAGPPSAQINEGEETDEETLNERITALQNDLALLTAQQKLLQMTLQERKNARQEKKRLRQELREHQKATQMEANKMEQQTLPQSKSNENKQQQQQQQPNVQKKKKAKQQEKHENHQQPSMAPSCNKNMVPPINIYKMVLRETIDICKLAIGDNFTIKRINSDMHVIQCSTVEKYNVVKLLLKESFAQYYSFTPEEEKFQTVVLKGIDPSTDPQALLEELNQVASKDLEFIKVKPLSSAKARQDKEELPIFIVQLSPKSDLNSLKKISVLDYQIVTWDKFKKFGYIRQCKRCQRFGHSAVNCEMLVRCSNCGKGHNVKECKITQKGVEHNNKLYCVLCEDFGHSSNFRGCPKFQVLKLNRDMKQKAAKKRKPKKSTQLAL